MLSSFARGCVVTALALPLAFAADPTPGAAVPKIQFEKYTLPNGLQVILHVDRKIPVVHVNQWFHVGSTNERIGRTGFAHLFEHMMFQGSKNSGKYFNVVETMGANLFQGGVNGTTDWDRTNYFATVPSGNLENLLWLESDRLATLPEGLTKEKLDNQRDVVKNERRQGLENQPYGKWIKLVFENLYPYRHPYANDVIGSHEDLTAASMEDVKDFFRTYYVPNNLSLVVAGDFDPAQAKKMIEKYFASIPPGPPQERPIKWLPKLDGERIIEVRDRVPQERTYIAWPTPAYFEPGDADLEMLSSILTDGLAARLNKALVYDRQLCSDVVSFQLSREAGSTFVLWATARPGSGLPEIEKLLTAEVARIANEGPAAAELTRAQAKWEFGFVSGLERIGGFGGKADRLNQYNTFLGDPDKFEADLTRHRAVTPASIKAVAAAWLNTPNRLIVRFRPETSGRESQLALDRSKQPPLGKDPAFEVPQVKTAKLANGMDLYVAERHELPKVVAAIATRAGGIADPPGKEGLASLVATTMKYGTRTRQPLDIENALGDLGTQIYNGAETENAWLSIEVLKQNLAPAFAILADVIRNPVFPESEFSRERKLRLDALAQESKDPGALSSRVGPMLAFGPSHPYGRPLRGLPATVERINRQDLELFYKEHWKPGSSALVIAGDITLAEAADLANKYLGQWSGGAATAAAIPAPQPMGAGKVYVVDRQDAAQTYVTYILNAPKRISPDYYTLRLADAVWGGGFKTRLNMNLREDKGYAYGAFSFPSFLSQAGSWSGSAGVQTDKTKESVAEFRKEVLNLAGDKPITEAELADAKANRIRAYAQEFETLGNIVSRVGRLWTYGLPVTELQRETTELERASLADVNGAAKKYAVPSNASLLLVGDWAKIAPGVRSLDLGEIVLLDENGLRVPPQPAALSR